MLRLPAMSMVLAKADGQDVRVCWRSQVKAGEEYRSSNGGAWIPGPGPTRTAVDRLVEARKAVPATVAVPTEHLRDIARDGNWGPPPSAVDAVQDALRSEGVTW